MRIKHKKASIILGISIGLIILFTLLFYISREVLIKMDESSQIEITGAEQFLGRDALLNDENADYHSYLLTLPDEVIDGMDIEKYYYYEYQSLNNLYTILLVYTLADGEYQIEKERLKELKMTYEGEEKSILKIENEPSNRECYLTIYDIYGNYEYVFMDDVNHRITCVFTQYMGYEKIPEEYQLKSFHMDKDLWESDKIAYNMYWFWEGKQVRSMTEYPVGE